MTMMKMEDNMCHPSHPPHSTRLTCLGEVNTLVCAVQVMAQEVTFEDDENTQDEGGQVHAEDHHVQAVPPVQEVAAKTLDPDLLTLVPEETCRERHRTVSTAVLQCVPCGCVGLAEADVPTTQTMWKELCSMFCCRDANLSRYASMAMDSPRSVMRNHR